MQVKQTLKIKANATPAQVPSTAFDALAGEGAHRADGLTVKTALQMGRCSRFDREDGCPVGSWQSEGRCKSCLGFG
jgi:hypothetical protein